MFLNGFLGCLPENVSRILTENYPKKQVENLPKTSLKLFPSTPKLQINQSVASAVCGGGGSVRLPDIICIYIYICIYMTPLLAAKKIKHILISVFPHVWPLDAKNAWF